MSEPSYYEHSQPESVECIIKNKQNEISEANARISKIQTELKGGPLNEETLSESLVKYQSEIREYAASVQAFANNNPEKEYNPYSKSLDQANNDLRHVKWLLQEREKKLGDVKDLKDNIIKLEIELTELKKLKNLAMYHKDLYEQIQRLGDSDSLLKKMTDPSGDPLTLPYIDKLAHTSLRFEINNNEIEFFPRERLGKIIQKFEENLKNPLMLRHMLYGTIGVGKSHLLFAMACYYLSRRDRVVYFNEADSALNLINWRKKFMFLLYQESRKDQPDVEFIQGTEEALALIEKDPPVNKFLEALEDMNGKYLRIFVDQLNTIGDKRKGNRNDNIEITKLQFEKSLGKSGAHLMLSSSANDEDMYIFTASNELKRIYIPVLSGLTIKEFDKWMDRCVKKLEAAGKSREFINSFTNSKDKILFLTGAAPLYLRIYFSLLQPTYDQTVAKMRTHKDILEMSINIVAFYRAKLQNIFNFTIRDFAIKCMTNTVLDSDAGDYIMRRYFYVLNEWEYDEEYERQGCCSCALAAEFVAEALRTRFDIDWSLESEYEKQIKTKKEFVAKLEEIGLQKIENDGLPSCGIYLEKPTSIKEITDVAQVRLVKQAGERVLYKALRENFEGIDALYLTDKAITGINFTINAQHNDPFNLFIVNMKKIPDFLTNWRNYKIYFVWMTTRTCSGKLFHQYERTVDGIRFDVRVEYFQEEVMVLHEFLANAHKARMHQIKREAAISTNSASSERLILANVFNTYHTRNRPQVVPMETQTEPVANADSNMHLVYSGSVNPPTNANPPTLKQRGRPKGSGKRNKLLTGAKSVANPDSKKRYSPTETEYAANKRTRSSVEKSGETRKQVKGKGKST